MSAFIPFDIPKILVALNEVEGDDCWGGGGTIGGSPLIRGSYLPPKQWRKSLTGG